MTPRRWLVWGLAVAAAVLAAGRVLSAVLVEQAWLAALGVPSLHTERWVDQVLLQGGAWVAGTAFAFANLHAVRRTILAVAVPARVANLELTAMVPARRLRMATAVTAAAVGALLAAPMDQWPLVAMARHGEPFGEIEGILGRDLGFYAYWLPLEEAVYVWALVTAVTVTAMVVVLYALTRSLRMEGRRLAASTHVRRHLSVLGALVLLLLAWSYRLDAFDLLQAGSGPDGLFTPVDHRVTLRIDAVLSLTSAAAALVVVRAGWVGQLRAAFAALSVVLAAAFGLRQAVPYVLHRRAARHPDATLADYRTMRALFSRRAYGVSGIRQGGLRVTGPQLPEVRLPDAVAWPGMATTTRRIASRDGDAPPPAYVGWRARDGALAALVAVPPPTSGQAWRLRRVTWASVGAATEVATLPMADPVVVAPGASGHAVVASGVRRGVRGAPLWGLASRVAHAWALRDPDLLRDGPVAAGAVILLHRDVRERVRRLAPVFAQGREVVPVDWGGRLAWAVHLYAVADRFPLSQRWPLGGGSVAYAQLAATAVVDAGTGAVRLVPAARTEPIARTWLSLLGPLVAAPGGDEALAQPLAGLPPASDGAMLQLRTVAEYGAAWSAPGAVRLPDSVFAGGGPPALVVRLDGTPLVGWSVPLLDREDRIVAVATVVGGGTRATWRSRIDTTAPRWPLARRRLVEAMGGGGAVGAGFPVVVPGESGLLVAAVAGAGDRVAVTDGIGVGVGRTVAEAMRAMRPDDARWRQPPPSARDAAPSLVAAARQVDRMREAMRRGDWSAFGTAFDSLARAVGRPPP